MLHVGQEDGDVDDVLEARAGVFQDGLDVGQDLLGLLDDVVGHHHPGGVDHVAGDLVGAGHPRADA